MFFDQTIHKSVNIILKWYLFIFHNNIHLKIILFCRFKITVVLLIIRITLNLTDRNMVTN